MSHYSVAVITETGYEDEVMDLLERFDEGKEVETYIYRTKETIIQEGKEYKEATIERIKNMEDKDKLIKYLIDPNYQFIRDALNAKTDEDFYAIETDGVDEECFDKYGNARGKQVYDFLNDEGGVVIGDLFVVYKANKQDYFAEIILYSKKIFSHQIIDYNSYLIERLYDLDSLNTNEIRFYNVRKKIYGTIIIEGKNKYKIEADKRTLIEPRKACNIEINILRDRLNKNKSK